jgi:hypothetical protein
MPELTDPTSPSQPTTPSHTDPTPSHTDPSPTHVAEVTHTHSTTHTTVSDPDPSIVAQAAADHAVQMLIAANGIGGSMQSLLDHGAVTTDQAAVLAQVDAVDPTASTDDRIGVRHGHSSGDPDFGPHTLGPATGPLQEGGTVTESGPHPVSVTVQPILDPVDPTVFDDAMLRRALRARMGAIQRCYETELTRTPGLAGRLDVSMQVERVGSLSHVEITDDTVGSRQLGECVVNQVRTIRLPNGPTSPVSVEYPIVFAPQS